jgi:cell division protein FtsI/penicillin-binding protein 2
VVCGLFLFLLQPLAAQRPSPPVEPSYLLVHAESGRVLASSGDDPARPVSIGSLVKPFTALAFAGANGYDYPTVTCNGTAGRCWLPEGHGTVGIVEAIAQSCNAYFHHLAAHLAPDLFASTLRWFGLTVDARTVSPDAMVGLGDDLPVSPVSLARAYAELARRGSQPGVAPLLQGMRISARIGTGRGVGAAEPLADALVKTGTSPCDHDPRATAHGHAVVVYPADRTRVVLLVRAHGPTGAETAVLAGRLLADLPEAR